MDYTFIKNFVDFFFYPLQTMEIESELYIVIYAVVIVLAVWSFLRRLLPW